MNHYSTSKLLESSPWKEIYLQGGKINKESHIGDGVCRLPELIIKTEKFVRIGCNSKSLDNGSEEFCVYVNVDDNFGDPFEEKFYKPRREKIKEELPNIPLTNMLNCKITSQVCKSIDGCIEYVLFENSQKTKLLVVSDPDIPLHIQIIMNVEIINEKLKMVSGRSMM